ncbi:thiolase family protein [Paeniglutamicibacter gangotriensis]|uniref:Probable acetyl-CoA acetyltransferase n=1 Tax=Paeniglutamicibacter gangotriensis Lz1y TaxID=1276920 RepID=M7NNV4_9MICC|nr:thiolase family protein [Paeniglutamicibacter gangotriensis]EMR00219.1 acetyl-CoA acetyltransferase [Paeniglutamicibacter gangotriensis Lz1y]
MSTEKIVILDGARTSVGRYGGSLNGVPAHELGQIAAREALTRSGILPDQVDEVIMGCVGQVGPDAYLARRVALGAGLPEATPAFTVNRLCGSGLQAIWSAAQQLAWGGSRIILAGGAESMSRMPFLDFEARGNSRLGHRAVMDGTLAMLTDPFSGQHMGVTAENVAEKYGISRGEQDEFAAESQRRASTQQALAAFAAEITAVTTGGRKPTTVSVDEHPRPDTTVQSLSLLKPAFRQGGSVTAGNASGVNDGAAAVLLTTQATARELGLGGLATLEHVTTAALDPALMGYAPTLALRKLFAETGLTPQDIDIFEVNEAFAAQAVAVIRDAGLDPARVNPHGGAIALGHPIGATGAILLLRAAKDLVRRDLNYAVVTMCIGGGQSLAALIKRSGA